MKTSITLISTLLLAVNTSFSQGRSTYNKPSDSVRLEIEFIQVSHPSCNGAKDGSASVKVIGGKAPYTYNWNTFPNQYGETALNLGSGTYFVYVKDANGKQVSKSIQIKDPNTSSLIKQKQSDIMHEGLSASVTGSSYYTFELDGNSSADIMVGELEVGVHKLVIIDDNNCWMTQYIQIVENEKAEAPIANAAESYKTNNGKTVIVTALIPVNNVLPPTEELSVVRQ